MIRHDNAGVWSVAPQDKVASSLAVHDKPTLRSAFTSCWPEMSVGSFTGACWW